MTLSASGGRWQEAIREASRTERATIRPDPQVVGQMSVCSREGRKSQDHLVRRDLAFLDGLLRGPEAVAFAGAAGSHSAQGAAE